MLRDDSFCGSGFRRVYSEILGSSKARYVTFSFLLVSSRNVHFPCFPPSFPQILPFHSNDTHFPWSDACPANAERLLTRYQEDVEGIRDGREESGVRQLCLRWRGGRLES